MATGRLAEFYADKGYGYIKPDDGSSKVFVCADDLEGEQNLAAGTPVRFSSLQGRAGIKAYNVVVLSGPLDADISLTSDGGQLDSVGSDREVHRRHDSSEVQKISDRIYESEIAEALVSMAPDVSAIQVRQVCRKLTNRAALRGWLRHGQETYPAF
jgi:CspA family cold shock protein